MQHAGAILSRSEVGADGRTPYQRLKGKGCKAKLPSFGEQVFYRLLRPSGARLNKLDAKYQEGTFLGIGEGSNEYYIGTEAGVGRSADIRRKPPSQQWSGAGLAVKGTPNFPNPSEEGAEVPINPGGVPVVMENPVGVIPAMPMAPHAPVVVRKRV